MNDTIHSSRRSEQDLARRLVTASGARPADVVTIAGSGHIEILIELIRRGFSDVLCRSAVDGPHMATPPADVLLAPNVTSETDLDSVLKRLGSDLRPCGILALSIPPIFSSLDERRLRRRLFECGFTAIERIAGRGDAGTLWCARKHAAAVRHAA